MSTATLDTVTINNTTYVRADQAAPVSVPIGVKRIIVADRGWVFVGDCIDNLDGSVTIRNAKNIRIWGTTAGLGELRTGPTPKTKADPYGTVRCTAIVTIAVECGW